jgi:hypothetical protein
VDRPAGWSGFNHYSHLERDAGYGGFATGRHTRGAAEEGEFAAQADFSRRLQVATGTGFGRGIAGCGVAVIWVGFDVKLRPAGRLIGLDRNPTAGPMDKMQMPPGSHGACRLRLKVASSDFLSF